MRLIVYSHDAYGLGNIRRMLAICKYLLDSVPELSILLISGSPVLHSFRMPQGLDYMKLPCLGRSDTGELSAKYLRKDPQEVTKLRSEIIRTAVVNFEPDLILVDKKPYGLQGELKSTLTYLKQHFSATKLVLLLRDILDAPEVTIKNWHQNDYYHALQSYYDQILVVGMPEIFDVTKEYRFPISLSKKTNFCGYIRREYGCKPAQLVRQELKVKSKEKLVLVTPGGGGDGYYLVETYLQGLRQLSAKHKIKSLIISGPEMPQDRTQELSQIVQQFSHVQMSEFTDDIASYMEAADAVVCMGGYNTICEVLSLSKRAVVVPRIKPVQEQWIRAQKMAEFGLFKTIHPSKLTPHYLINSVLEQLNRNSNYLPAVARIDLNALPRIQEYILELVFGKVVGDRTRFFSFNPTKKSLISVN
ncbi:glycosyltransferase family protein [Hydrococcus rivularis]|nr:glycosyltransferase [Hydrococcus rivularis]